MRNQVIAFAIVSATSWFVACGTEPIQSTGSNNKDGGSGNATPGSGGTAGSSGSGNTGGTTGGTATGGTAGTGGGIAGTAGTGGTGGTGGTAGTNAGGGGMAGTQVVVTSLCDNKPKKALPFNIANDYRAATIIGSDESFHEVPNPDCGGASSEPSSLEAGTATDAGSADSADESQSTAVDAADSAAADASVADVSATDSTSTEGSTVDGPVDAGPPPACYAFNYDPAFCEAAACWAGVIFQVTPVSGMGGVGICIEPGATKIEFWAKASRNMARIKFGSIREGMGTTEFFLMITTEWAKYSVTIPAGDMYNETTTTGGVWNGFSAVVEPGDHAGGTTFAIKDIVWMK